MISPKTVRFLFRLYAISLSLGIVYSILSILLVVSFGWHLDLTIPYLVFASSVLSLFIIKHGLERLPK